MPGSLPTFMVPGAGAAPAAGPQRSSQAAVNAAPAAIVGGNLETRFLVWLAVLGVIVPVLILGGLKLGKFQFVYRR